MGESFYVDTDGIAKSMPGFRALGDQVRKASEFLHGQIGELGECWGNDHSGQQFAEQYLPARDQMADGAQELYKVLQSTGDGIETMAKGFARNEQQNAEAAQALMPREGTVPSVDDQHGGGDYTGEHTPRHTMLAKSNLMPSYRREAETPVEPLQPLSAAIPAEPGLPAERYDDSVPAEPLQPVHPLEPSHYTAAHRTDTHPRG